MKAVDYLTARGEQLGCQRSALFRPFLGKPLSGSAARDGSSNRRSRPHQAKLGRPGIPSIWTS